MQSPPHLARYRLRGWLLLALCPLVAAIAYLVFAIQAPPSASWTISLNDSNATWDAPRFKEYRFFRLDYHTATVSEVSEFERQSGQKNSKGELIVFRYRWNESGPEPSLVEVLDPRSRKVLRSIELPGRPTIIGGHFAVAVFKGTLYCTDLDAAELECKTLSVSSAVEQIADAKLGSFFWTFLRPKNSPANSLDVYKVADDASLTLVHSFTVFGNAAAVDEGEVRLLTADRAFFEVRDLSTGKLIRSAPVPPEYMNGSSKIDLWAGYLAIEFGNEYRLFDPIRNIELEQRLTTDLCAIDCDEKLERLAVGQYGRMKRARIDVFDLASGKVSLTRQTTLPMPHWFELRFVNRDTLMIQHTQNGLTLDLFDIPSGKLVRRIAPYGWCTWALPLLFATLAIWTVAWLRASANENGLAWIDVCLLTTLALTPLVVRLISIYLPDVSRLPVNFSQGIVSGLANVCGLCMAMGRTRFTLRILPFLATMALLIGMIDLIFPPTFYAKAFYDAMNILSSTLVTAIGFCFVYVSLHWFGWSAQNVNREVVERHAVNSGVPMRDYFLLTAVLAILVTVARGLIPGLPELLQYRMYGPEFLISLASFAGMAVLTLSKSRIAVVTSQVIALMLFLVVIGYPIAEFILGIPPELLTNQPQAMLRVIAAGVLSTFVYLQAYRLRGWRLGWRTDKDNVAEAVKAHT